MQCLLMYRLEGLGEDQPFTEILPEVLRCYAKCIVHGHRHVHQALPRMLTIYFEHGSHCQAFQRPATPQARHDSHIVPCKHSPCSTTPLISPGSPRMLTASLTLRTP